MSVNKIIVLSVFCLTFCCISGYSYADNEKADKQETTISKKIDTKELSGINLQIAELYNKDRVLFAIAVTLVMAILGSILAYGTDFILKYFGLNVSKISHNE